MLPVHRTPDPILPWLAGVVLCAIGFVELRRGAEVIGIPLVAAAFVVTVAAAIVVRRHRFEPSAPEPPGPHGRDRIVSSAGPGGKAATWSTFGAWAQTLPAGPPKKRGTRPRPQRAPQEARCRALLSRSRTALLGFDRGPDRDSARVGIAGDSDRERVRCRIRSTDCEGVDFRNQVVSLGAEVADEEAAQWHVSAIGVVTEVGRVPDPDGYLLTIEPVLVHCRRRSGG